MSEWVVRIPTSVLNDTRIKDKDFRTLLTIMSHVRANENTWVSLSTIAKERGKSPSNIKKHILELEELGLVKVHRANGKSNKYSVSSKLTQPKKTKPKIDTGTEPKNESGVTQNRYDTEPVFDTPPYKVEERRKNKDKKKKDGGNKESSPPLSSVNFLGRESAISHLLERVPQVLHDYISDILSSVPDREILDYTPYVLREIEHRATQESGWVSPGRIGEFVQYAYCGGFQGNPTPWAEEWRTKHQRADKREETKEAERDARERRYQEQLLHASGGENPPPANFSGLYDAILDGVSKSRGKKRKLE